MSKNELLNQCGIFIISSEIDEEVAERFLEFIFLCHTDPSIEKAIHEISGGKINIIINSPGGCLHSTMAIVDAMRGSKFPVVTTGIGTIMSGGLMIFMSGNERQLTKNCIAMSHQASSAMSGKTHEILAQRNYEDKILKMMINMYKENTGLDAEQIKTHLLPASDVYLDAEECLKFNLADKIIPSSFVREVTDGISEKISKLGRDEQNG